ncbi:hypothetical protein Tco_0116677 [Tanacetum coccineum]
MSKHSRRNTRGEASSSQSPSLMDKIREFGVFESEAHQGFYNNIVALLIQSGPVVDWAFFAQHGGKSKTMSLLELGWRVGLYSEDFASDDRNRWTLQNSLSVKRERDWKGFWPNIRNGGFIIRATVVNNIKDPRVFLDHRCLTTTISARNTSNQRITTIDMFYLY